VRVLFFRKLVYRTWFIGSYCRSHRKPPVELGKVEYFVIGHLPLWYITLHSLAFTRIQGYPGRPRMRTTVTNVLLPHLLRSSHLLRSAHRQLRFCIFVSSGSAVAL
jgi:hypothetical protein